MDDLRTIREAYGDPAPPTLREMTEARAAMFEADGAREPRRARFGWRLKAGIGLAAAGAAAAVAIAAAGTGSPAAPPSSPSVDLGKGAVLAAAEKAEAQPTGRYWFSDRISGQSYIVRSRSGAPYAIAGAHSESFSWHGVKAGMGEAYFDRDLPARPLTEQDAAVWRADGSPSSFRVWSNDAYRTYTAEMSTWRSDGPNVGVDPRGGGRFALGKSAEELQNLPTDPAELTEMFLDENGGSVAARVLREAARRKGGQVPPDLKLQAVGALLAAPTPPKVRAGLMRALADQPGVHAAGKVTDPLGREGVALAADPRSFTDDGEFGTPKELRGTYSSRTVIVFDERTGALLSLQQELTSPGGPYKSRKPGFVIHYDVFRDSGWTDAKPSPPAKPPF